MFSNFHEKFSVDTTIKPNNNRTVLSELAKISALGFDEFMNSIAGYSYNQGLYRTFNAKSMEKWNHLVGEAFPEFKSRIYCFGCDWLGRIFALDKDRLVGGEPQILLMEPGTGDALEIPSNLIQFHEEVLLEQPDAAVAQTGLLLWTKSASNILKYNECVGYIKPLFLGGADDPSNFEIIDMEVYWGITSQLFEQLRNSPQGTKVNIEMQD